MQYPQDTNDVGSNDTIEDYVLVSEASSYPSTQILAADTNSWMLLNQLESAIELLRVSTALLDAPS